MYEYKIVGMPRVVDGDTLDAVLDLGFGVQFKQRMRLSDINAPESITSDEVEKRYGKEAKAYVEDWIKRNTSLWARTTKDDKYGRILAVLYSTASSVSLNTLMLSEGYAWSYDGGGKSKDFAALDQIREQAKRNRYGGPEA